MGLALPSGLITAWTQGYPWLGLTTGWMLASVVLIVGISLLVPTVFLPRGRATVLSNRRPVSRRHCAVNFLACSKSC